MKGEVDIQNKGLFSFLDFFTMRSNESTDKKEEKIEFITASKKDKKKKNDPDEKDKEKVPTDNIFVLNHSDNKPECY